MGLIPSATNEYATSDWRSPDKWVMNALFFDFNGDGREEAFVSYGDWMHERGEHVWSMAVRNSLGKVAVVDEYSVEGHAQFFMRYEAASLPPLLVQICTRTNEVDVYYQPRTNKVVAVPLEKGIQHIIARKDFKKLSLVDEILYATFNLNEYGRGRFKHPVKTGLSIPHPKPDGLDDFVENYRKKIKREKDFSGKLDIYVVLLDVNNDLKTDVYITSSVERVKKNKHQWHLYLNENGALVKATKRLWFNRFDYEWDDRPTGLLDPDEVATKYSFYRVCYYGYHTPKSPTILIADYDENGVFETSAYRKLVLPEELATRPKIWLLYSNPDYYEIVNWEYEVVEKRLGCTPPHDFRNHLLRENFFALERLPCEAYRE